MQSVFSTKDDDGGGCDSLKIDVEGEGKIVLDKSVVGSGCNTASWVAEISVISASSSEQEEEEENDEESPSEGSGLDDEDDQKGISSNGHLTAETNIDDFLNDEAPSLSIDHENDQEVGRSSEEEEEEEEEGDEKFGSGDANGFRLPCSFVLPSSDHPRVSSNRGIKKESGCHFTIVPDSLGCRRRSPRQVKTVFTFDSTSRKKRGRGRGRASEGRFICNRGRGGRVIRAFGMARSSADSVCGVLFNKVADDVECDADEEDKEDVKRHLPLLQSSSPFREFSLRSNDKTEVRSKQDEHSLNKSNTKVPSLRTNRRTSVDVQPEGSDSGVSNPESVESSEPKSESSKCVTEKTLRVSTAEIDRIDSDINKSVTNPSYVCENDSNVPEQKPFRGVFWRRRRLQQYNTNNEVNRLGGSCFSMLSPSSTLSSSDLSPNSADKTVPSCRKDSANDDVPSQVEMKKNTTKKRSIPRSRSYLKKEVNDLIEGSIKVAKIAALTNGVDSPALKRSLEQEHNLRVTQTSELSKLPSNRIRGRRTGSANKPEVNSVSEKKSLNCKPRFLSDVKIRGRKKSISTFIQSRTSPVKGIRKLRRPFGSRAESFERKELNKLDDFIVMPRATKCKAMQKITELVARKKRAIRMKLALEKRKKTGEDQSKTEKEQRVGNIKSSIEAVIKSSKAKDSELSSSPTTSDSSSVWITDSGKLCAKPSKFTEESPKKSVQPENSTVASMAKLKCQVKIPQLQLQSVKEASKYSPTSNVVEKVEKEENLEEEAKLEDDDAVKTKRPIGRPRIHRPPNVPGLKPVRLSRNGRRLGRPPTRSNPDVKKSVDGEEGAVAMTNPLLVQDPFTSSPPPKILNLSIFGSKTSCRQSDGSQYLEKSHSKRSSIRQTECAFRYREIALRKHDNFIQIVLTSTTRVKNGLNVQVLRELKMALVAAKSDSRCHVVLLNGTGSVFCSGIDLISLVNESNQTSVAEATATALREFSKTVLSFPKPLVAAVNGAAVGLGVTILPLFDLVYASDKATFYTPYGKLGQIPEGGATFSLPLVMGYARANGLLLSSRRLTATEALECGLVTQVLWPATFMEEVIPRVQALASQSLQTMGSTKALIRYHSLGKLEVTLDTECRMLAQQWASKECVNAIREFLQSEEIV